MTFWRSSYKSKTWRQYWLFKWKYKTSKSSYKTSETGHI